MNKYEIAIVLSAKIDDEGRTATMDKINNYIVKAGGTVEKVDEWGKRRLAYEIQKVQKMREGFYYFIKVEANSDLPREIESRLRIMEPVLRYLCIREEA